MKTVGYLLVVLATAWLLSGCNTTRGVGQDIEGLGHAISRVAS